MSRLREGFISVVDMPKVTKSDTPRKDLRTSAMTQVGQVARERAILEGERRFCGNKSEHITGDPVPINKVERVAMLLDLRTAGGAHVDKETYTTAKEDLKEVYLEFALQCEKFDEAQEVKEKEKETVAAAVM